MKPRKKRSEEKGLWFTDNFKHYIKGYSALTKAVDDGLEGLRNMVDAFQYAIFPSREVPSPRHLGYVTHEHDYFHISHPNDKTKEVLESYFLDKHSRFSEGLYEGRDNLSDMFSMSLRNLLIYGKSFCAIEWQEVEISKKKYILPTSFHALDVSSTRKSFFGSGFRQKYSLISYFTDHQFKKLYGEDETYKRKFKFKDEEVIYFKYPFHGKSPVQRTYKLVPVLRNFWQFGINQQRTSLEPDNHTIALEKARYKTYKNKNRENLLLKSKLMTTFKNVVSPGLNITQYYDVYTVIRYRKHLNDLRNYLVEEFNKQVLQRVAEKNEWKVVPVLSFDYFQTNTQLDQVLKDFSEQKIAVSDVINLVVNKR